MDLLATFDKFHLLHPKVFGRQHDLKYWSKSILIILIMAFASGRYAAGGFSPQFGLMIGNYFNVFGVAGQLMSLGAGMYCLLGPYCRMQLMFQRDRLPFIFDLMDYNDSKRKTILTGEDKSRLIKFNRRIF